MASEAIVINNITKTYLIGKKSSNSLRETVSNLFTSNANVETFHALNDVSFTINQGDVMGIVGKNGAGKSTLLKILSRITQPTSGSIEINGRVASLLEVGTGFHPELTGRENIYLNGTILGMSLQEVKAKFDEIVDFSGIEKFIDTAVKHYSSGMYVRLAFAVSAFLETEILVLDEVLAVGDADFQKKCLGKMSSVSKDGRTVLFVSHNLPAVKSLCTKAVLLRQGQLVAQGDTESVVHQYQTHGTALQNHRIYQPGQLKFEGCEVLEIGIRNADGDFTGTMPTDQEIHLMVKFINHQKDRRIDFSFPFKNEDGEIIFVLSTFHFEEVKTQYGENLFTCNLPANFLNTAEYYVDFHAVENRSRLMYWERDTLSFTTTDATQHFGGWIGREAGFIKPLFKWKSH